jgi:hypothetical protein
MDPNFIKELLKTKNLKSLIKHVKKEKKNLPNESYDFIINFINSLKKTNLRNFIKSLKNPIHSCKNLEHIISSFLLSLSEDPIYVTLDTNFSTDKNEVNYNALVQYFDKKEKELRKKLDLPLISLYSFFVMDDDFIPFYNSVRKNTYDLYVKRKIEFLNKSSYVNMLTVLNSDMTYISSEKDGFFKTLTVCRKIGQGAGAYLQEFGEALENGNAGAIALLVVLIIIVAFFLFAAIAYLGVVETDITFTEFVVELLKGIFSLIF